MGPGPRKQPQNLDTPSAQVVKEIDKNQVKQPTLKKEMSSPRDRSILAENGSNMPPTWLPKWISFLMPLGLHLWVDLVGFWVPKSSQVGAKMESKIDVNFDGRKPSKR